MAPSMVIVPAFVALCLVPVGPVIRGDALNAVANFFRLDPAMEGRLTETQLRSRERFLVQVMEMATEADELHARVQEAVEENGGGEELRELERDTNRLRFQLRGAYRALEGGGVRQGSLYPPTDDHEAQKKRAAEELERLSEAARRVLP